MIRVLIVTMRLWIEMRLSVSCSASRVAAASDSRVRLMFQVNLEVATVGTEHLLSPTSIVPSSVAQKESSARSQLSALYEQ